jgi:DNA replication initiation complex subunit (GINS family)
MINYNDLYELLRKEKYNEQLQLLPKDFLADFSDYVAEQRGSSNQDESLFMDSAAKAKKQLENSLAIFKELVLRRKKKLLNLVFVAAETGIMKRDYENMLSFERDIFDKLVKAIEEGDKELSKYLHGKKDKDKKENKMIIFNQAVDQFMDMTGSAVGPFISGELANLDPEVSAILVSGGKANFVDES